jgi:hypothetical protein
MIKYLKENACFILFGVLVVIISAVVINAVADGIDRIITQKMINDTYKINK